MSTNKTQNYQLHNWVPEDKFLRAEINENFARLDGSARVVVGSYEGDGAAERTISLGFQPKAVLVVRSDGRITGDYDGYGGLAFPGRDVVFRDAPALSVTAGGFRVCQRTISSSWAVQCNSSGQSYYYLAVR